MNLLLILNRVYLKINKKNNHHFVNIKLENIKQDNVLTNTFVNSSSHFPTDKNLYDIYIERLSYFDVKFNSMRKLVGDDLFNINRHYFGLGVKGDDFIF